MPSTSLRLLPLGLCCSNETEEAVGVYRALRIALIIPFILLPLFVHVPAAFAANNPPVSSVGEVNFDTYCKSHGYKGVKLVENTAYGWRCEKSDGKLAVFSVTAVCREANKDTPDVLDWFSEDNYFNAYYAWGCAQLQHGYQGRLDMDAFCKMSGSQEAILQGTGRHSVDDWACKNGDYVGDVVLSAACGIMYGASWSDYQVPRFNYWDPYSVTCWR
jgi:hypothetical protein